jgi:hypothetical protein
LRVGLDSNRFPSPEKQVGSPAAPKAARTQGDKQLKATEGSYPLASSSFLVGPQVIVGLVAPHAGVASGTVASASRAVPMAMRKAIGPMIGHDSLGNPAHLNADDLLVGTAIVGQSNSGKSNLLRSLYGWAMADRLMPSGRPGFPGANNAMIAIESKGDGADGYAAWADAAMELAVESNLEALNPKWQKAKSTIRIDATNKDTFAINFFPAGGTLEKERATALLTRWHTHSVRTILASSLTQNLTVSSPLLWRLSRTLLHGVPDVCRTSPIYYAYTLVGGWGDQRGVDLAMRIIGEADRLVAARTRMLVWWKPRTNSVVTTSGQLRHSAVRHSSSISSWKQLLVLDVFFEPSRKLSWKTIITKHEVSLSTLDLHSRADASQEEEDKQMSDRSRSTLSGMLIFTLKQSLRTAPASEAERPLRVHIQ